MHASKFFSRTHLLTAAFILSGCLTISAASNLVCIHLKSGQKLAFTHENHPMLIFESSSRATIKADHKEVSSVETSTLHKITFGDASGIADAIVDSKGQIINAGNSDFILLGFDIDTPVTVASLAGIVMTTTTINDSAAFLLSLDGYAKGVYIITVGSTSYKVALN